MVGSPLAEMIEKYIKSGERYDTDIRGLSFHRSEKPTEPVSYMFAPHLCLIAQGAKHIILGDEDYLYDKNSFVLSSVDLPLVSKIIQASEKEPYLGLTLELDLAEISRIITEINLPEKNGSRDHRGIGLSRLSAPLLDAVLRLLNLLDCPGDIPVLAPVIKKEIYYRLLTDGQGYKLQQIVSVGSRKNKISKAIGWLKENFDKPLQIKKLADYAGMSESTFYQHFRSLTAMSPVQYQKKIRLNEAKRLMLVEKLDAGSASFQVGYESPTQFSREYKRMFGRPPKADIRQLQAG